MPRSASPAAPAPAPAIVWFRQDLRLADNPALDAAARSGRPILALYVLDDQTPGAWSLGGATRWWLHHSLTALGADLEARGARLILRRGRADEAVRAVAAETAAEAIFWNRLYEPYAVARDTALKSALEAGGVAVQSFNSALLNEPWTLKTGAGEPFKVYSPFWRAALAKGVDRAPLPAPKRLTAFAGPVASDALSDWALLPTKPDWAGGLAREWTPGEAGAKARLARFFKHALKDYAEARNLPGVESTSKLSPHLRFGEISPLQIWHACAAHEGKACDKFLSEIGWREFAYHLLFHYPDLPHKAWRAPFDRFPWRSDSKSFKAWTRGRTGYPMVDAGMRELWETGFMHNRVRMIAASFLIKHLMIDWRDGEAWFWDTLVDADLANNAASWQWVAGSGADAAPYFRVFNPVSQGAKFDPDGAYVRRYVPELARLPNDFIHAPWEAPALVLQEAGIVLGETYPLPIVDHAKARQRALDAYASLKQAA